MARFEPFAGVRYDTGRVDLADVTAPPYDVIDAADRARLVARSPHNAVRVDLPADEDGVDRYEVAARLYTGWQRDGILVADTRPSFYVYAMTFGDEGSGDGSRRRRTLGVIGALELQAPGTGDVLPHEETTPRARSDRLSMLQATDANLSAIWGLSLTAGLSARCEPAGAPDASFTDEHGVTHELWSVEDGRRQRAIAEAVSASPVVIADGHHRYETSLAYREERRRAGAGDGPHDLVLAYVVELSADQLAVGPIHRLLSGLPPGLDLAAALEEWFEVLPARLGHDLTARMAHEGALGLVLPGDRAHLLRPRDGSLVTPRGLDSERLDVARAGLPAHEITYQHGVDNVVKAVDSGDAQAGVLLRPVPVTTIEAVARAGERMPPKSTYFFPKPRTGMVFRSLVG